VTEGNGHVIDPNGDARRALQEAVAEHGPEVLSNAAVIDAICQDHLAGLPGESILIGDAARTNVPALLSDLIPQLGNYGAIQSAAATLAGEHNLDMAASLWVVREFARALGHIAPATGASAAFPGSGPRPVPGSGPRPVPGSEGSGTAGTGREESGSARPGGGETGSAVAGGAVAGGAAATAAGVAADQAGRGESAGSGPGTSGAVGSGAAGPGGAGVSGTGASGAGAGGQAGTGGQAGAGGETIPRGVAASRAAASARRTGRVAGDESAASGGEPGYGAGRGGTGQASGSPGGAGQASGAPGAAGTAGGGPGATGPVGSGPGVTGPMGGRGPAGTGPLRDGAGAGGPAAGGAWAGPSAPGRTPGSGTPGSGTPGSGTGGGGGWGGAPGGAAPEGEPGFPLPLPAGRLPGRQPPRSKLLNRNTVGIAAAIALVAGYLGVAAAAHLSPFPAKTAPTPSASQSSNPPASTGSSPASSPDPSADSSPPSQLGTLQSKIPTAVQSRGRCLDAGTDFGATAVIQCQQLQGLAASTIVYYLYPNRTALASGLSASLTRAKFSKQRECTTNGNFSDFLVECESSFTIKTPGVTGSVAEFVNKKPQGPVIVSTDNEQKVMAVLIGTNDGDLLAYWKTLGWVVTP
jgi:hypothetical protein